MAFVRPTPISRFQAAAGSHSQPLFPTSTDNDSQANISLLLSTFHPQFQKVESRPDGKKGV